MQYNAYTYSQRNNFKGNLRKNFYIEIYINK